MSWGLRSFFLGDGVSSFLMAVEEDLVLDLVDVGDSSLIFLVDLGVAGGESKDGERLRVRVVLRRGRLDVAVAVADVRAMMEVRKGVVLRSDSLDLLNAMFMNFKRFLFNMRKGKLHLR